jgi:hypothetical protein
MEKKTGIRSQSGRPKRDGDLDQGNHRKSTQKKQVTRPEPLWLQVLPLVD